MMLANSGIIGCYYQHRNNLGIIIKIQVTGHLAGVVISLANQQALPDYASFFFSGIIDVKLYTGIILE